MGSNVSGELTYAILASVLASFILTWVLLAGYRRAVARTMRIASAQPEFEPSMVTPPEPSAQPHISAFATRRRLALVYSAATGLSALVLALPLIWKLVDEAGAWWWPGMVGHWLTLWAPSVILVCALLAARRRATILALFATWLLVVASAIVFSLLTRLMAGDLPASGLAANVWQTSKQFLVNAIVPLALVYVTGRPRLRNVLPLILVVVILLSFLLLAYNRGVMANQQEIAIAGTSILTWLALNRASMWTRRCCSCCTAFHLSAEPAGRCRGLAAVAARRAPLPGAGIQQHATGGGRLVGDHRSDVCPFARGAVNRPGSSRACWRTRSTGSPCAQAYA